MSFYYQRPSEEFIYEKMEPVSLSCPVCGSASVKKYRALKSIGWHLITRCRDCFHYLDVTPVEQSFIPLTKGWKTSSVG